MMPEESVSFSEFERVLAQNSGMPIEVVEPSKASLDYLKTIIIRNYLNIEDCYGEEFFGIINEIFSFSLINFNNAVDYVSLKIQEKANTFDAWICFSANVLSEISVAGKGKSTHRLLEEFEALMNDNLSSLVSAAGMSGFSLKRSDFSTILVAIKVYISGLRVDTNKNVEKL